VLYQAKDVEKPKGLLAQERLLKLNPNVKITIIQDWLTNTNADGYFKDLKIDYLVDASDNFETKFLINDLGLKYDIPFTIAGIHGFEGQILSTTPNKTACYRCIFGDVPAKKEKTLVPVVSPLCGVVGSLQESEVLKGLLDYGSRILNQLLMIDLDSGVFTKIPIKINQNCRCQQQKKKTFGNQSKI
jgi:molybdopterin-synthase adenylyltransferase